MIRPAFRDALLERALRTLRVVWIALGMSVAVYVMLGTHVVTIMPPAFRATAARTITTALYGAALAIAALSIWWQHLLAPEAVVTAPAPSTMPRGWPTPESDDERRALAAFARFQRRSVTVWAFSAAVAMFGFVLTLGTGDVRHVVGLALVTLVLLVGAHAPTRGRLEAVLAAVPK